mmetsp:Transcript_21089/g.33700  ORF Transcript_21089/g.33700 Transcript_21089/m.33700 type:complete len:306 (-) Transcript_21089:561-1478(-)
MMLLDGLSSCCLSSLRSFVFSHESLSLFCASRIATVTTSQSSALQNDRDDLAVELSPVKGLHGLLGVLGLLECDSGGALGELTEGDLAGLCFEGFSHVLGLQLLGDVCDLDGLRTWRWCRPPCGRHRGSRPRPGGRRVLALVVLAVVWSSFPPGRRWHLAGSLRRGASGCVGCCGNGRAELPTDHAPSCCCRPRIPVSGFIFHSPPVTIAAPIASLNCPGSGRHEATTPSSFSLAAKAATLRPLRLTLTPPTAFGALLAARALPVAFAEIRTLAVTIPRFLVGVVTGPSLPALALALALAFAFPR